MKTLTKVDSEEWRSVSPDLLHTWAITRCTFSFFFPFKDSKGDVGIFLAHQLLISAPFLYGSSQVPKIKHWKSILKLNSLLHVYIYLGSGEAGL